VLLVTGCYGSATASYNPGDASQLVAGVSRRGVAITSTVSGDSGCQDPTLINNALHLSVTDPGTNQPRDVYIYSFREKTYDAGKPAFDACAAAYQAAHAGQAFDRLDIPVYRAFGVGWSSQLSDAIRAALQ
jgi:hypothetical protein